MSEKEPRTIRVVDKNGEVGKAITILMNNYIGRFEKTNKTMFSPTDRKALAKLLVGVVSLVSLGIEEFVNKAAEEKP